MNYLKAFILLLTTVVLAACGGSSGGSGDDVAPISAPYTGMYVFDSLLVTADNGSIDSESCDPFEAEFSYSPERSIGKIQCGIYSDESLYYYIDTADSGEWVSCEEVQFTVTGDYTAEITYSCTDYLDEVYLAVGSVTKVGDSFTVLTDENYWEDSDEPR
ncbi:hypothetical protein EP073_13045 [Geovibrio thiophilus]|uniref:Lipocalin-like domain-containing protein n=1 Tax=Geovibrio thiophilus TaxID=139438 RepID=A0A3R5XYF2_9BACT|nr:hypothetical protein [Geovibrio thiophilus]QAR34300.1 hypothetical protein EP073_13045 [Geovibrio thiophilus]